MTADKAPRLNHLTFLKKKVPVWGKYLKRLYTNFAYFISYSRVSLTDHVFHVGSYSLGT